jgi:hypothetical protein
MTPRKSSRLLPLVATALVLAACGDTTGPVRSPAPGTDVPVVPGGPSTVATVSCTASLQARTVNCGAPDDGLSSVIIGGQHQFVTLTSSNISVNVDTFAFDVTVTNLIPQTLGTTDGSSADAAGVRVFFASGPTASPAGTVTVANPDGTGTFTAAGQPYFQYAGLLEENDVSAVKRWKLQFSPGVTNLSFTVLVSTAVQYPNGYIDDIPYVISLDPNEARTLTGTARNFAGTPLGSAVNWGSNAPATASISGSTVTAGGSRGTASLTATSGATSGLWSPAVSVCQSAVVTSGTNLASSIAASDCFSSYGSNSGTPSTSYYADLFRVTLTAGQTITVTMDSGDDLDTYLLLAAPGTGILVAGNDDDPTEALGVGSRMTYTATATGVYVIEASTFNGLDTGNYTLGVSITG